MIELDVSFLNLRELCASPYRNTFGVEKRLIFFHQISWNVHRVLSGARKFRRNSFRLKWSIVMCNFSSHRDIKNFFRLTKITRDIFSSNRFFSTVSSSRDISSFTCDFLHLWKKSCRQFIIFCMIPIHNEVFKHVYLSVVIHY